MKAWALPLSLLLGTAALRASAEEAHAVATLDLSHGDGASGCMSDSALTKAVEQRLHRRVFVQGPADLKLAIRLERAGGPAWRASLILRDGAGRELGRRELATEAHDCSSLDASLALVVALLIDTPPEPEPSPEPTTAVESTPVRGPPPKASRPPTTITLPKDTDAPRAPWRVAIALSGALVVGTLPGVAPGAALALELEPPHFATVQLFAEAFPARTADGESTRPSGVRVSLARAGILVCPLVYGGGGLRIAACAGEAAGRVAAEAFGFDRNEQVNGFWFSLQAGAIASLSLFGPVALRGAVLADAPITRDGYVSRDSNGASSRLFRPAPVALEAQLGLGVEL